MTNKVNESCYKPSKLSEGGKKEKNQILDENVLLKVIRISTNKYDGNC